MLPNRCLMSSWFYIAEREETLHSAVPLTVCLDVRCSLSMSVTILLSVSVEGLNLTVFAVVAYCHCGILVGVYMCSLFHKASFGLDDQ